MGLTLPLMAPAAGQTQPTQGQHIKMYPGSLRHFRVESDGEVKWMSSTGDTLGSGKEFAFIAPLQPIVAAVMATDASTGAILYSVLVEVPERTNDSVILVEASEQGVRGRFGQVLFEAELLGQQQARARYWIEGGDLELAVEIHSPERGELIWAEQRLDGYGAATTAELDALHEIAAGPLWQALSLTSLDLACLPESEEISPAAGAALLMPWQAILKYLTPARNEVIPHFAGLSACGYFEVSEAGVSKHPVPAPGVMLLSHESPVPATFGFFPFDGSGQVQLPQSEGRDEP